MIGLEHTLSHLKQPETGSTHIKYASEYAGMVQHANATESAHIFQSER
jgi:hypothetical protein